MGVMQKEPNCFSDKQCPPKEGAIASPDIVLSALSALAHNCAPLHLRVAQLHMSTHFTCAIRTPSTQSLLPIPGVWLAPLYGHIPLLTGNCDTHMLVVVQRFALPCKMVLC